MAEPDLDHLRQWLGREEFNRDVITGGLVERLRATLADLVDVSEEALPLALHWCLAPPSVRESETGADGHPARGGFLPPVENARRMWGGGSIEFIHPFEVGDEVERISTIADIDLKAGRSGKMVIVGVDHEYRVSGNTAVRERQNILYRLPSVAVKDEARTEKPAKTNQHAAVVFDHKKESDFSREGFASTLLMFRYSALTFNGHRIHYDREYAMQEEGYRDLVFHGPLQATLLANYAREIAGGTLKGRSLRQFTYKGVAPLFGGSNFTMHASAVDGGFSLWVANESGNKTMIADAVFR